MDGGRGVLDGKAPAQARHVPEELIVVLEESELAIGGVGNRVDVAAARYEVLGIAKINTLAIRYVLDAKDFHSGIAGGGEHLKSDGVAIVEVVAVGGGKVTIDAVANLICVGEDRDSFGDLQRGVAFESDVAMEVEYLFGLRARGQRTDERSQEQHTKPSW